MSIYSTAVNKPISTLMIFLAILVLGVASYIQLPVDQFPKMDPPYLTVMATYPGANASDIEENVTKILEDQLNSVDELKELTSTSYDNLAVISLEFEWEANLDEASNDVRDAVDKAMQNLPDDIDRPTIMRFNTSMIPILTYAVTAKESYSGIDKILDDKVVTRLNRVDGVASVTVAGAPERVVYVDLDPNKLDAYNLTLDQIGSKILAENIDVSAGSVKMGNMDYSMRVEGEFEESDQIKNIVIGRDKDKTIFLHDIATVRDTLQDITLEQTVNRGRGCVLMVSKQTDANAVAVAKEAKAELEIAMKELPADIQFQIISDNSDFIVKAIDNLQETLLYALIFVVLVVFLFLWLSFGSIELSLLAFLPLAVSWIWILGIMQILGLQFNIVNIILATFIFGQGDDYTIFITEGLMYEYTTGRKRLARYKSSVALSAIIMFIGIGTLIFSKHPAMRSLAEVVIIGMITVVVMAYYLPPLVFRWLTEKNGKRREYPVTLWRLSASAFSLSFFICGMFLVLLPFTFFIYRPLQRIWNGEKFYHRLLQRISGFVIRHVPGVKFKEINEVGESFAKPAVIVCNHQSHLDLMCAMQLSPKIIVLTNDWVWNNPYYGMVIHTAEFRPVSNGYDENFSYLQDLVRRGYSILVFPEGTRTPDGQIGRFHKGAFTLAKALGVDILPICIHGLYDVLPKHDFMLRRGSVTLEICGRITSDAIKDMSDRAVTSMMYRWYKDKYATMRQQLETSEYMAPYVAYKNKYKVNIS